MISRKLEYPDKNHDWEWEWEPPLIDGNWEQLSPLFQDEINAAKEIVIQARFPSSARRVNALDRGDPYAFVAVLLSQLHNSRALRLDYTFVWQSGFPGLMMRHAFLSAPPNTLSRFSKLSLVEYGLNVPCSRLDNDEQYQLIADAFPFCNHAQFAGWFYLPSLQSLEIWPQSLEGVQPSKLAHLANLERLVLTESSIDEYEVRDLLSCLSSVKIVHLGLVYPSQDEENGNPFASPRPPLRKQKRNMLLEGLMNIKDTVEHLSIGFDLCPLRYGTFWDEEYGDIEPALMPFRDFLKESPRLRTAEVPAVMLFGWVYSNAPNIAELLPTTLQRLILRENMSLVDGYQWELGNIARAIQLFLLHANTATPLLKTIMIRASGVGEEDNYGQEHGAAARSTCQELGMNMDITLIAEGLSPGLWTTSRNLEEYIAQTKLTL